MSQIQIFNSRSKEYKYPFGAVKNGTQVRFTVKLPESLSFSTVHLCVYDGEGFHQDILMLYHSSLDNAVYYRCSFTPEKSCAFFYYFRVEKDGNTQYVKRAQDSTGYLTSHTGDDFQLTVYDKDYKTPDFLKGGIIYQIFPDRFYYSGIPKENVPLDRKIRSDWGGMPYFLPNEKGEVLNDDYFCGDLKGIEQKLPYLESLGVTMIYLNPIFESHSSHRYNTANYEKVDPLLGTEQDFKDLCVEGKKRGIRIILDGVFSHTGDDSIYFNRKNRYDSVGAYNSPQSPYYSWYKFVKYPDVYESWWGFTTLPTLEKSHPDYVEALCGPGGVIKKWLHLGASGFRLDVADELPSELLQRIRTAIKEEDEEYLLVGEVWEDASNKMAYGVRRKYFMGKELDSVMNYPFKDAIIWFIKGAMTKADFINKILTIVENYPPCSLNTAMNSISTHDIERAITLLAGPSCDGKDRYWQSHQSLSFDEYELGVMMLECAMVLQFFLPGVPCIYYGDEAGLQGYKDPFNRKCYPWGCENEELLSFTKRLTKIHQQAYGLKDGDIEFVNDDSYSICFTRNGSDGKTILALNYDAEPYKTNINIKGFECLHGNYSLDSDEVILKPHSFCVFTKPK